MAKKTKKSNAGRPPKYTPKFHNPWVKALARSGLTGKEIAAELGIAESTLYKWANDHEEFSECLKEGRSYADAMVEDSLYRKALGGTYTETRQFGVSDGKGGVVTSKVEKVTREVAPDTSAAIFWLKNRQPDKWRDKREYVPSIEALEFEDNLTKSLRELGESL